MTAKTHEYVACAYDKILPIEELKPNPRNPNRHPKRQIALLAKIMSAQGFRAPIVVSNLSGLIVKGHARLEAARALNLPMVPVDYQDYRDADQELADMIADNEIARLAETDTDLINEIALDLGPDFDFDLLGIPDFFLPGIGQTNELDQDESPSPLKLTIICKSQAQLAKLTNEMVKRKFKVKVSGNGKIQEKDQVAKKAPKRTKPKQKSDGRRSRKAG